VFRNFWPLYTSFYITITQIIAVKTVQVGVIFLTELAGLQLLNDLFLTASNLPSHTCITRIEYMVTCSSRIYSCVLKLEVGWWNWLYLNNTLKRYLLILMLPSKSDWNPYFIIPFVTLSSLVYFKPTWYFGTVCMQVQNSYLAWNYRKFYNSVSRDVIFHAKLPVWTGE